MYLRCIAFVAVIGFSFAALSLTGCDTYVGSSGGGGGGGDTTTYTDKNTGDTYTLTIKPAPKPTTGGLVNGATDAWVDSSPVGDREGYIFKADGTYHDIYEYTFMGSSVWAIYETGRWSTSGNNLTLTDSYGDSNTASYSVSGNTLTLGGSYVMNKTTVSVPGRSAGSPAPAGIPDKAGVSKIKRAALNQSGPADRAAYVAQDGDTYTLTWKEKSTNKNRINKGTVTTVTGTGKLTLNPEGGEASFTVTTTDSDGSITIAGNIKWDDGKVTTATITLTTDKPIIPKAWTTPSTNGRLTVNGLSAHNGKYVLAMATKDTDKNFILEAFKDGSGDAQGNFVLNFTPISNGSATLNVWKIDETKESGFVSYSGTDSVTVMIAVYGTSNMSGKMEGQTVKMDMTQLMYSATDFMMGSASFSGGKATVAFQSMGGIDFGDLDF